VLNVRQGTESDLPEILEVDTRAAAGNAQRIAYLTRAIEHDDCLVAVDGRAVRGFVVVKHRHFYGRDFIDLLMVAEDHQRHGLGGELMRTAVATAMTAQVFTSTNESNAPMQALLASKGWECSGKLDGLDEGDPELVYFLRR
jgi:predicted N-acetyltransferase YhbS